MNDLPWMPTAIMASTFTAMSAMVTIGRPLARMSRKFMTGEVLAAPLTHSGHWKPTDAGVMQLGQMGRLQRWHVTPARRSGWR